MPELSIRKIIEKTLSGEIRIPSFQRGFVWEPEKVAFFIDSLYKGYPIGSLLFWRTNIRLENERQLGNYSLPEPTKGYPLDYVLDGQQRITSIFSVFQTELTAVSTVSSWMDIYYILGSSVESQQSQFVPLDANNVDAKKHFPLNCLFDSVKYRKATEHLPYPAMLVSLVKFFGTTKKGGAAFTDLQRQSLIKWFWRSCFSRRYSSGVNSAHETDLQAMERLVFDEQYDICSFKCEVSPTFFTDNVFNLNTVNTKTFVALLASTSPKSFISGANVNLSEPMKLANSKEFHHIFPAKYLQRLGLARNRIFCLANFCFLNNADNQRIKDKAPAEYCKMMNSDKINDILQSALCPSQTFCLDYDTFLNERSKILVDQAKVLCGMAG